MASSKKHLPLVLTLIAFMGVMLVFSVLRLSAPPQLEDLQRLGAVEYGVARNFDWPELIDEKGLVFEREQFSDYWTLIFFGFTHCPDICPATMSVFAQTERRLQQDALRHDTRYLMISVDPTRDTPQRLNEWLQQFSFSLKGLSGNLAITRQLARDFNVAFQKAPHTGADYNINHSGNVFLVGPDVKQHGFVRAASNAQALEQAYRAIRKRFELNATRTSTFK